LRIRDDGQGIEPALVEEGRSGRVPGMRERSKQIGAEFTLWSMVGSGIEVKLSIPTSIATVLCRVAVFSGCASG
jgi:signal transduction histidine kinase